MALATTSDGLSSSKAHSTRHQIPSFTEPKLYRYKLTFLPSTCLEKIWHRT